MKKIKVNLGARSYDILIGAGGLDKLAGELKKLKLGKVALVLTNPTINQLYGSKVKEALGSGEWEVHFSQVPDSEESKSMAVCMDLIAQLADLDRGKGVFVLALGGGVVGDLAGFAASIYRRGVPCIQIPTTLLAQVDSAIGGKTALDLPAGKNLIGSFYQPRLVLSDLRFLGSLEEKQIRSALAEIIKYAIIADKQLFQFLEKNLEEIFALRPEKLERIVEVCSRIKAKVVERDETDQKEERMILNFGHTIGHALEAAAAYSPDYSHGYAIALGMLVAAEIAKELKMLSPTALAQIEKLIQRAGLPTKISGLKLEDILRAQSHDKKFSEGRNRFVLPVGIGKVVVKTDIPEGIVAKAIQSRM